MINDGHIMAAVAFLHFQASELNDLGHTGIFCLYVCLQTLI